MHTYISKVMLCVENVGSGREGGEGEGRGGNRRVTQSSTVHFCEGEKRRVSVPPEGAQTGAAVCGCA